MLSLDDIRFFTVVAGSKSLAEAARALDVSPPAVTQRLQLLEGRLKVQLVHRSPRRLVLSDEGELLMSRGLSVLADVDRIADAVATRRNTVTGHLRIVAPLGFGRRYVAPILAQFRSDHPEATVSLTLSDTPHQLSVESWDVLIHIGELRDSSMIMFRLAANDRIACASPGYLKRKGHPKSPEQLREHDCIALRENEEDVTLWRFSRGRGRGRGADATVRIHPVMASNDGDVVRSWALAGHGVIVRSEWDTYSDIRAGRLVQVLPGWRAPPADVIALLGERSHRAARTSRFLELLKQSLTPVPWRIRA
ncbi:MAG: LysR family transcriptional regulator [Hyphomonadaceae bacterium]|nr:LysR family transcriptional regulator [Hyphomonadaceae bacterium]